MFSFGVLLCELITGKTSSRKSQHYPTYKLIKRRRLEDDADECVDWESGDYLTVLMQLAMECLEYEAEFRPSIGGIVEQLQESLNRDKSKFGYNVTVKLDAQAQYEKCRICGEMSKKSIRCFGSEQHLHCHNCVEKQLIRNANKLKYEGICCLKEGCGYEFQDSEVESMISANFWQLYLLQRSSADMLKNMVSTIEKNADERLRQSQELQLKLCAGNGLPCPKLFILVEADRNAKIWRNPREW